MMALLRILVVLAFSALLVTAASFAPAGMRRLDAFQVRDIEVTGIRLLSADAVVAASGITRSSNVFDDPAPVIEALLRHPLVADVHVERRLPATLVLHVREAVPVAFARTPELRAIDENGRILPADPAADGLDLPVIGGLTRVSADGRAADAQTRRVTRFLGVLGREEPGLLGWISEISAHGDAVRLVLRNATDADVLVPSEPTPERLRELHLTLAELATPRFVTTGDSAGTRSADADLARVRRIDVRFHDQIVVALHRGRS